MQLSRDTIRQLRYTAAGRFAVNALTVLQEPLDYYERRTAATRYTAQMSAPRMSQRDGYVLLRPGELPGTLALIERCRRLFAIKKAALEASAPTGKEALRQQKKKVGFLKDLLTNDDLRDNPELVDFALGDRLLSTATNYLGIVPNLTRVDLVYSVPRVDPDEYISSQLYHQDPEGLRQVKVFMNLFDVGDEDGPFVFLPASESERVALAIRDERRRAGARDDVRLTDDELKRHVDLSAAIRLTGPAGSAVAVDTSRCLHAGSRIRPGHFRLVLFIQYCPTPEPKAQSFDARRFRTDRIRWLAVRRYAARD